MTTGLSLLYSCVPLERSTPSAIGRAVLTAAATPLSTTAARLSNLGVPSRLGRVESTAAGTPLSTVAVLPLSKFEGSLTLVNISDLSDFTRSLGNGVDILFTRILFLSLDDRRHPHFCDRCQSIFYHLGHRGHLHHHHQEDLRQQF